MTDAVISRLIADIRAALLVLNQRGAKVTPEQADERARNIVQSLVVNFEVRELPRMAAVDFDTPLIVGRPVGHSWSCRCDRCDAYKRGVQS